MTPFTSFAPDIERTTPGVIVDCENIIPSAKGFIGSPGAYDPAYGALSEAANKAAILTKLNGTTRIFAGTETKIYELDTVNLEWDDVTRVASAYASGTSVWAISQFGDTSLAVNKGVTLQASSSGVFADVTGAPKAECMDVSSGFVMLANTNESTYSDSPDRWWCSAYLDHTDWTPSSTTQCTSGRLVDSPGPIVALKAFGSGFVAYKEGAIFVASYVGAPEVWTWTKIPGRIGVSSKDSVVNVGYAHFFVSDDFYLFDGVRPQAIGSPVRDWFMWYRHPSYTSKIKGIYDSQAGNVYWWFVPRTTNDGSMSEAIVYNIKTQKWGRVTQSCEAVVEYQTEGITYDELGAIYTTFDDLPTSITYDDSNLWFAGKKTIAVFDTDHSLKTLSADSVTSSITTWVMGDDIEYTTVTDIRPRFLTAPTSSTCEEWTDDTYGDTFTLNSTSTLTNAKYDFLNSARWHRFKLNFSGNHEIVGIRVNSIVDGQA